MDDKDKPLKPLFARQAIYNNQFQVSAFELLFRQSDLNISLVNNHDEEIAGKATSNVLTEFFSNAPISEIVGNKKIFINFSKKHLITELPFILPKERVVIEVLESVETDDRIVSALHKLKDNGYTIALDDFEYNAKTKDLIQFADIIKIDVLNKSKDEIARDFQNLEHFKGDLLAEKIEEKAQYEYCNSLGFKLFQGYFLNKPEIIKGKDICPNKVNLLQLLAKFQNPDIEFFDVENLIITDPKLSYRILLIANSAAVNMGKKVDSISEALIRLGLKQIKAWVSLLMLSKLEEVPMDLLEIAIIRSKMCEILARKTALVDPDTGYTVGLVSSLEAILKISLQDILMNMNLSDDINKAINEYAGPLGTIIKLVLALEKADFSEINLSQLTDNDVSSIYCESLMYARRLTAELYRMV